MRLGVARRYRGGCHADQSEYSRLVREAYLAISEMVHAAGGLLYYDGAKLNAIMGMCTPGDMGSMWCI
jgi:hypothetical protein